jgi:hypothetical protein
MDLRKAEGTVISLRVAIGRGVLMAPAVAAGEAAKAGYQLCRLGAGFDMQRGRFGEAGRGNVFEIR